MSRSPDSSANIEAVYPLSPMQEGMLFHTLLAPSSGIYLMQNRYRLEGAIDERAFVEAWRAVTERHPMLRTSFVWKTQKRPLQVVHKRVELPFDVLDLSALSPDAQEARITDLLSEELLSGFDLGKAPPLRYRLLWLGDRSFEFVHSFHHILLDEWCTSLLMADFTAHYEGLLHGTPPTLPPARPYRDYVDWLGQRDPADAEAFWRDVMRGFAAPTLLGLELVSAAREGEVEDVTDRLSAEATAALQALAQRHRFTLNTLVQGAWALLLARYSGEQEVVFGVTVAGRPPELPNVDTIVGLFINTLPLRVAVSPEQPLVPWLVALLAQNFRLRQFEHTPLVDVQRWSEIERGQELFQSLFVFENAPLDPTLRAGKSFRVEAVRDRVHTNYPLTVMAWPDTELGLKISYDAARVRPDAAQRMLGHLRTLLEGMAARPEARLGELTLLSDREQSHMLAQANDAADEPHDLQSYSARFEAQVARTPRAVAVSCEGRDMSYGALNERANQVAHALMASGTGPEARVVLVDERGIDLLTMMLGVFKASAAYVPVEPSYPPARVAALVRQSGARVVLTRARLAGWLRDVVAPLEQPPEVLALEDVFAASWSLRNPAQRGAQNNLAYVIFTSGSTGVPKGAMVERAGMLNNMLTKIPRLGLTAGDVIAQTASPCFDISVWQHLTALLFGGRVEIIPDEVARDPALLLQHVERTGVTVLEVVPAVLQGMLDAAREQSGAPLLSALRWLLPTGEALPVPLARAWLTRFAAVPLLNAYGPAECSDDVALHEISEPPAAHERTIPIGTPVEHLRLYVLDALLDPLPVGVVGELYVGGIGVGRGYLGEAVRTAAAFLPDPFSRVPGRRIYRTGDLARRREDGTLEFAGRRDHQVKLRGLRIELGEIEARLAEHPSVQEAVVLLREEREQAARLVAYVVARDAASERDAVEQQDALMRFLGARLPAYMVPHTYVLLDALPHSANGKIDRKALPAPESDRSTAVVTPRTETEAQLATIWREVIGLESVSVEASFFALGGHSLQLTQVLVRVRKVFGLELPLRTLFESPTIAAQARAIDSHAAARASEPAAAPLPRLVPLPETEGPAALSFAQERLWFLAQLEPSAASYNVPAAVRVVGPLDVARLADSVTALVRRHPALRTRFVEGAGGAVTVVDAVAAVRPVVLSPVDLRALPAAEREAEARRYIEQAAAQPFELGGGTLFRLTLVQLGDAEHVLAIVLHHIISDGWSMRLLVREVGALYAAEADERASVLPPLPLSYGAYVAWQRALLAGPVADRQLAYHRERLSGVPTLLALPIDRPRQGVRSYRGARHTFLLPRPLAAQLIEFARKQGVTPYVLLLSAFEVLLAHVSGQTSFTIGTPVAGRTHEELEGLIGLFVNTLVLRADVGGDPSFVRVLERVREEVLGAQAHQELPFERLVQALRPARDLGRTPLFQVLFSLEEAERALETVAGLSLASFDIDPGSAQFDLSLHMALEQGALSGSFEYSSDVFEASTVASLATLFTGVLERVVAAPSARLSALELPSWSRPLLPAVALEPPLVPQRAAEPEQLRRVEEQLASIWAEVLGRARVERDENFFELGGDSILSLDVVARARRGGLRVTPRQLFQYQTVAELAQAALVSSALSDDAGRAVTGELPLLPIQRRFFARGLANPGHWNQSLLLTSDASLSEAALERAVEALVTHHDALRLRFLPEAGGYRAEHAEEVSGPFVHLADLSTVPAHEQSETLERHAARWQASLDLASGPLLRVVSFRLGGGQPDRLLMVLHHLVTDGVSWRILLDDLESAYEQASRGELVVLPDKSVSYKQWAERLVQAAEEPAFAREASAWLALPWQAVRPLPVDDPAGEATVRTLAIHDVVLAEPQTRRLLEQAGGAYRMHVDELLLAALAVALARWSDQGVVAVDVEGHGRESFDDQELDLSRTVGWFTSAYPVVLEVDAHAAPGVALCSIKEQLRKLPRGGLSYGVVRELGTGDVAAALRLLPQAAPVAFNYLGQWDSVLGEGARFRPAAESAGPEHDPRSPLPYQIEIDAAVYGGKLEASFRYAHTRHHNATIERLGALFSEALSELIDHCVSPDAGGYTPSDFPDVALSSDDLSSILGQMD